jgi:sugar phosphate isomerase/epimerase
MVAVTDEVEYELRCAREYGLGAEVQTFSLPSVLMRGFRPEVARMARRVGKLKGPIGCHGPFIDTVHFSLDQEIRRVARMRYLQALDIAQELGAAYLLLHSQYNPIIKIETYPDIYHNESLRFWPEILEEAAKRELAVYLENMFDASPEPLRRLLDALGSPTLKLCLDLAHARVFSELDVADWIETFGPHLRHVHMNDSRGMYDDHLGLGQGILDLNRSIDLLKKTGLPLTYALETARHTSVSLRYLGITKVK